MARTLWTPAIDKMMVKMWNAGASTGEIADALTKAGHVAPTRGSILGRIYRMRAVGRFVIARPNKPRIEHKAKTLTHRRDRFNDRLNRRGGSEPKGPSPVLEPVLPGDAENPGTDGPEGCRWILRRFDAVSHLGAIYCGKARVDRSWCAAHHARVFPAMEQKEG